MTTGKSNSMSKALYEERNRRLLDQVALKETDRIPFVFGTRFWAAKFAGITFEEQMYDADKSAAALERVLLWLEPDGYTPSLYVFGQPSMHWTIGCFGGPGTVPVRTRRSSIWTRN
jgi:hypothetical protein